MNSGCSTPLQAERIRDYYAFFVVFDDASCTFVVENRSPCRATAQNLQFYQAKVLLKASFQAVFGLFNRYASKNRGLPPVLDY
jgi:hypothetical protein